MTVDPKALTKIREGRLDELLAAEAELVRLQARPSVARIESIIHDWMCGCGRGEACDKRGDCREAAEQIADGAGEGEQDGR